MGGLVVTGTRILVMKMVDLDEYEKIFELRDGV